MFWCQNHFEPGQTLTAIDLFTSRVSRVPLRFVHEIGRRNESGLRTFWLQKSELHGNIEVIEDQTGKMLGEQRVDGFYVQVGCEYFVSPRSGAFVVQRLRDESHPGTRQWRIEELKFPVSGATELTFQSISKCEPIEGSNRFLVHFPNDPQPNTRVFELQADQLQQLASWPTAKHSLALVHEGQVFTASPNGKEVEVRSLNDFRLLSTRPLPQGLNSWTGLADVTARHGLFSFADPKTAEICVHRLEDFSRIPELKHTVSRGGIQSRSPSSRYVILNDVFRPRSPLTVYDLVDRRIVLDQIPPDGCEEFGIVDHFMVYVTGRMGLTIEMIDLTNPGAQPSIRQPFAWILWCLPAILFLALMWVIVWIRAASRWPRYAVLNALTMAALFVTPQLVHAFQFRNFVVNRPALGYSYEVGLVLQGWLGYYVAFGRQRFVLRLLPLLLVPAGLLGLINLTKNWSIMISASQRSLMWENSVAVLLLFPVICASVFACVRWWRSRFTQSSSTISSNESRGIPMRDMFLLTALIAAVIAAAVPYQSLLIKSMIIGSLGSLVVAGPFWLGLVSLTKRPRLYGAFSWLALTLAVLLIVEVTLHLWLGHRQSDPWYHVAVLARYCIFLFIASFAIGSILKHAINR